MECSLSDFLLLCKECAEFALPFLCIVVNGSMRRISTGIWLSEYVAGALIALYIDGFYSTNTPPLIYPIARIWSSECTQLPAYKSLLPYFTQGR